MLSKILLSKTIQKRPTSKSRSLRFILIGGVKCHTENFYPVYGFAPFPALFDDILIIPQFQIIVNNQFICLRQNHIGTPLLVPPFYRIMFLTSFSQTCLLQTSLFPPCLISGSVSHFFFSWKGTASTWNLFKPLQVNPLPEHLRQNKSCHLLQHIPAVPSALSSVSFVALYLLSDGHLLAANHIKKIFAR